MNKKQIALFLVTFVVGAFAALLARTAMFDPHAEHAAGSSKTVDHATVANTNPSPAAHDHAASAQSSEKQKKDEPGTGKPVNTVCAICGMEVDPKLPTLVYRGKTIGFGCRMCPAKFKADPDRYGPYYLRNEVMKNE